MDVLRSDSRFRAIQSLNPGFHQNGQIWRSISDHGQSLKISYILAEFPTLGFFSHENSSQVKEKVVGDLITSLKKRFCYSALPWLGWLNTFKNVFIIPWEPQMRIFCDVL